jgi:hypothetical protein
LVLHEEFAVPAEVLPLGNQRIRWSFGGRVNEDRKKAFAEALNKRGVLLPCPRCGARQFEIADETVIKLQPPGALVRGGPAGPVVVVLCANCGFVSMHASGILDLLTEPDDGR